MARKRRNTKKGLSSLLQINSGKKRKVSNKTRITTTIGKLRRMVNAARKNRRTTIKVRTH